MKRFLTVAALMAITLFATQETQARPSGSVHNVHPNCHTYSCSHRGFTSCCWNSRHNCYWYYCGSRCCYYYWYAPRCCYVPVTYIAQLPPVAVTYQPVSPGAIPYPTQTFTPVQVNNINTNTNTNTVNATPPIAAVPPMPGLLPKLP